MTAHDASIRNGVEKQPTGRHSVASKFGESLRFADLSGRGAGGRAKVCQRIPDLDEHEHAARIVAKPDVDRPGGSGCTGRQLKVARTAVPTRESEHQLLRHDMPGIGKGRRDVPAERDGKRTIEHRSGSEPHLKRRRGTLSALQP
jgi:hypothetical protein